MTSELVISATQESFRIALLQDRQLVEYHTEDRDSQFTVGDIYLGTVKKLVPNLNASFVDIGYKKDGFLHYSDLGPQFHTFHKFTQLAISGKIMNASLQGWTIDRPLDKLGKISEILYRSQSILVQITKEPISSKGHRLSAALAIAGRYMILVPFSNEINISRKITSWEEKNRLLRLIESIKPSNFGLIVRTAAEKQGVAKLNQDLKELLAKWSEGIQKLAGAIPRDKIIGEMNRAASILRDMLSESFDNIVVDDKETFTEIKQYINTIAPEKSKIVKNYQGKVKLFEHFGIEKQLKILFGQSVSLEGGGYLMIEHTEAMHVIDVNSGSNTIDKDHEAMALSINLAAAKEIARQLRLRDMGGIIVIDFIDVKNADNKRALYQQMKQYMQVDRSKVTILPLSKFGIMQMTRQRARPVTNLITQEECPSCGGTGKIAPSILIADQIESNLQLLVSNQNEKNITLLLHPYLYAYFTYGLFSKRIQWLFKYKKWIRLSADSSLGIIEFKFINSQGEEIQFN